MSQTKNTRDIRGLRNQLLLGQFLSLGAFVFGGISLSLFLRPSWFNQIQPQEFEPWGDRPWFWIGITLMTIGGTLFIVAEYWFWHLLWVYAHITPRPMLMLLQIEKDSSSTSYYAFLKEASDSLKGTMRWKIPLYKPTWNVADWQATTVGVNVFFDPKSQIPAVIETEYGLLWKMFGNGAIQEAEFSE